MSIEMQRKMGFQDLTRGMLPGLLLAVAPGLCVAADVPKEAVTTVAAVPAESPLPLSLPEGVALYSLDKFGPIKTPQAAAATYKVAMESIGKAGGGILLIPGSAPAGWIVSNNFQRVNRKPAEPAPAKSWEFSAGVTVIDTRGGTLKVLPPQVTGIEFNRTFNLKDGQSAPHWTLYPMLGFHNNVIRGSTSYLDFLQADVTAGKDAKFYVPTIRGLFPGMFINAHGGKGYGGGVARLWIKELGYDKEKKMSYIVADTDINHVKGAILHNKTHVNVARMETNAHTELQSFDFMNERYHYSQGDTYMYDARLNYMGNIHSAAGDENGVLYAAFAHSQLNIFKGTVAKVNPAANEVTFTAGANAQTLGSGRPLINLNPKKAITGTAIIVAPGSFVYTTAEDPTIKDPVFEGKSYPTQVVKNPVTGNNELSMGGLIRLSADTEVTPDIIGRYIAIDEPTERVKGGLKRWYQISSLTVNPDKTKTIKIVRYWWGTKEAGAPTLYLDSNYSKDGNVKPLKIVIAPGANVYDVSRAVTQPNGSTYDGLPSDKTLLVDPTGDRGTAFDFEPGDTLEQAVGSDPFQPVAMRAWMFDDVPSSFPAPVFDVANNGVRRASVMSVAGAGANEKPAFDSVVRVNSRVGNVVTVEGEVTGSVLSIAQRNRTVPITWSYDEGRKQANLSVDYKTGVLKYDGGPVQASGFLTTGGLSGTEVEAKNLRGIAVPVPKDSKTLTVKFQVPEADEKYAVFLETTWLGQRAITERTSEGFTVTFAEPAPANATLDWTLIR